ncbi:MAG: DNA-3-methyladenine glycosylase 2 family protein [Pseudomonadota bacterium]
MRKPSSQCDLAHQHLAVQFDQYPRLAALLQFNGQMYLVNKDRTSLLERLCRAIAGQQLSTKAASTIWNRVKSLQKEERHSFARFLATAQFEDLRSCGLSNAKTKTLIGLSDAHQTGQLSARKLKYYDLDELIAHLSSFWGVGQWTAEMCAIGYFKHADVWSTGDVGLRNAITKLTDSDQRKQDDIISMSAPYRSYLSLHLWSALDNGFFDASQSSDQKMVWIKD